MKVHDEIRFQCRVLDKTVREVEPDAAYEAWVNAGRPEIAIKTNQGVILVTVEIGLLESGLTHFSLKAKLPKNDLTYHMNIHSASSISPLDTSRLVFKEIVSRGYHVDEWNHEDLMNGENRYTVIMTIESSIWDYYFLTSAYGRKKIELDTYTSFLRGDPHGELSWDNLFVMRHEPIRSSLITFGVDEMTVGTEGTIMGFNRFIKKLHDYDDDFLRSEIVGERFTDLYTFLARNILYFDMFGAEHDQTA